MGSFANTLFSVLLGWVQSAVSWVWRLFSSEGAGGLMGWVLDNWLALVIVLCAAGVVIDLVVYLFRWQPYRVWRSFWRGDEEPGMEAAEPQEDKQPTEERQWVFADGSMSVEAPAPQEAAIAPVHDMYTPETDVQLKAPVRPVRRVIPARRRRAPDGSDEYLLPDLGGVKQAYHQPFYPPQWRSDEQKTSDEGEVE